MADPVMEGLRIHVVGGHPRAISQVTRALKSRGVSRVWHTQGRSPQAGEVRRRSNQSDLVVVVSGYVGHALETPAKRRRGSRVVYANRTSSAGILDAILREVQIKSEEDFPSSDSETSS